MKAFLAGLGIGIGVGIIFAPESGEVNREKLKQRLTKWSEDMRGAIEESRNRFQSQQAPSSESTIEEDLPQRKAQARAGSEDADPINTMSAEELMDVTGIGPVLADRIITNRPYSSRRELVEREIVSQNTFDELEREIANRQKRSA